MITTVSSQRPVRRPTARRLGALLVVALGLLLGACQGDDAGGATPGDGAGRPLGPTKDPRVQPHLATFQRTEALVTHWDDLRGEGRVQEAKAVEPKIRAEVDGDFATFEQAATGALGPHAQYLAVSALGFSANPRATRVLLERLGERDAQLQGNALIALGIRRDPDTPLDVLLERVAPAMPATVKRYAPLAVANVLEARTAAGRPMNTAQQQKVLGQLGSIAIDHDPATRLHVVKALRAVGSPAAFEYFRVLVNDPQMRVRWAAAGALADVGDPRGFPDVVRLLGAAQPESKHIVRDVLVTYAGRMRGTPLSEGEIRSLGTGPRAWSQWFEEYRRSQGLTSPRAVPQPVGR